MNETEELKEALKESKDKAIFFAEADIVLGIQIAMNGMTCEPEAIGVKDSNIAAIETALKVALVEKHPKYPFILTFDSSDPKERNLNEKIIKLLEQLGIKYISYPLELMRKIGFKNAIPHILAIAKDDLGIIKKSLNDINAYKQTDSFLDVIYNSANAPAIKTGFPKFDEALGGGLRAGRLYGIGAITSLGKTTFVLQIADNIARTGQDVLIFSLEMSRYELMGKSISRGTYKYCVDKKIDKTKAISLQSILDFSELEKLQQEQVNIIDEAIVDYRDNVAKHVNISEGVGDIGTKQIKELVEKFCIFKSSKPVVIIDYLQILSPFTDRLTDKQNIDKNVLELKRICRDYQVPVIIINSFNRANYLSEASFESFKESGAIEYSCDVLIALQLHIEGRDEWTEQRPALNEKRKAVNEAKIKSPREVEAIILKNRGYQAYDKIPFQYLPEYDYFDEDNLNFQSDF
jgi:replicative DNA helicase